MTRSLHEWMGFRTCQAQNVSPWVKLKSQGRAYMPSPEFVQFLGMAEVHFKNINGNELSKERNPIGKMSALLRSARPDIYSKIIEAYSRARFTYDLMIWMLNWWSRRNKKRGEKLYIRTNIFNVIYYCYNILLLIYCYICVVVGIGIFIFYYIYIL